MPTPPPAPPPLERDEWAQLFRDAYCDQMTDAAEPLDLKAVEGLSTCLNKSTELNWFNEWSKLPAQQRTTDAILARLDANQLPASCRSSLLTLGQLPHGDSSPPRKGMSSILEWLTHGHR